MDEISGYTVLINDQDIIANHHIQTDSQANTSLTMNRKVVIIGMNLLVSTIIMFWISKRIEFMCCL